MEIGRREEVRKNDWKDILNDLILGIVVVATVIFCIAMLYFMYQQDKMSASAYANTEYTFEYENVIGTVVDKDTETVSTGSSGTPYYSFSGGSNYGYGYALHGNSTKTIYKTKVLLEDGNMLIFDNQSLYNNSLIGEEMAIEIERKYKGEELISTTYKVVGTLDENTAEETE